MSKTQNSNLIQLGDEQKQVFDILENGSSNVFVTGRAGTGKSVLLKYFKENSKKAVAVVAPTGVAALNIGGQTIHSLFKIAPELVTKEKLSLNSETKTILKNVDTLVVDEISMVRADLMDGIDYLLKKARANSLPFGGVQMVMFGDLYQLSPVVEDRSLGEYLANRYGGQYFFNATSWLDNFPDIYELRENYRQKDKEFKKVLDKIRSGDIDQEILETLNEQANKDIPDSNVVTMAPTNRLVSAINSRRLKSLEGKKYIFKANTSGALKRSAFPTDQQIHLKEGAQVMLVKNDPSRRWVNGTIGLVSSISVGDIEIDINGSRYMLERQTWSEIKYHYDSKSKKLKEKVIGKFTQFPLRLAWAATIHKSQGKTYQAAVVDMGRGAFAHGQTYVALSRCQDLKGLYLKRKIFESDIIVDPQVTEFMSKAETVNY